MIHNEHFDKADRTYEVWHDNNGNAIHILIKDGEAIIYPTIYDLFQHFLCGMDVERMYVDDDVLNSICALNIYNYYEIKNKINYQL